MSIVAPAREAVIADVVFDRAGRTNREGLRTDVVVVAEQRVVALTLDTRFADAGGGFADAAFFVFATVADGIAGSFTAVVAAIAEGADAVEDLVARTRDAKRVARAGFERVEAGVVGVFVQDGVWIGEKVDEGRAHRVEGRLALYNRKARLKPLDRVEFFEPELCSHEGTIAAGGVGSVGEFSGAWPVGFFAAVGVAVAGNKGGARQCQAADDSEATELRDKPLQGDMDMK